MLYFIDVSTVNTDISHLLENSKSGSTKRHKQIEMHEDNASLVMLSRATDVGSDVERQKPTQDKYVHKKFKRVASANFDDNYGQEKQSNSTSTHIQLHINESPSTIINISQSVSSGLPFADGIVSFSKLRRINILFELISYFLCYVPDK